MTVSRNGPQLQAVIDWETFMHLWTLHAFIGAMSNQPLTSSLVVDIKFC